MLGLLLASVVFEEDVGMTALSIGAILLLIAPDHEEAFTGVGCPAHGDRQEWPHVVRKPDAVPA
jgi:hypothetical protein